MKLMDRLYAGTKEQAVQDILATYRSQGWCVLSFVYFSDVMKNRLLEEKQTEEQQRYEEALQGADFILPDGIALQLFYRLGPVGLRSGKRLKNLNGTDFIPYLMSGIVQTGQPVHVGLYDLYDEKIGKSREYIEVAKQKFLERFGVGIDFVYQVHYSQRKTAQFDFAGYEQSLVSKPKAVYRLLRMSVGTPDKEIRAEKHRNFIEQHGILLINAGGTLDYISGFEKRAPQRVVKARVLETFWRVLLNPQKNLKKLLPMFGIFRYRKKMLAKFFQDKIFPDKKQ